MRSNCPGISQISKGPSTEKLPGLFGTPTSTPTGLFIPFLGTTQSVPLVQPALVFNTLRSSWNPETVGGEQSRGHHSSRSERVGEEAFLHSQACGVGRRALDPAGRKQPAASCKDQGVTCPHWYDQVTSPGTSSPAEGYSEKHLQ